MLGWAAWPITKTYWDPAQNKHVAEGGYNYAWWTSDGNRTMIVPTISNTGVVDNNAFCAPGANECQPPSSGNGRDLPAVRLQVLVAPAQAWKSCASACGNEASLRYDSTWAGDRTRRTHRQPDALPHPWPALHQRGHDQGPDRRRREGLRDPGRLQQRRVGQPRHAELRVRPGRGRAGCPPGPTSSSSAAGSAGTSGSRTRGSAMRNGDVMKVTGTWELDQHINGWARVLVHIPKRRAETQQAPYTVHLGDGSSEVPHAEPEPGAERVVQPGRLRVQEGAAAEGVAHQPQPRGRRLGRRSPGTRSPSRCSRNGPSTSSSRWATPSPPVRVGTYYPETDFEYRTPAGTPAAAARTPGSGRRCCRRGHDHRAARRLLRPEARLLLRGLLRRHGPRPDRGAVRRTWSSRSDRGRTTGARRTAASGRRPRSTRVP